MHMTRPAANDMTRCFRAIRGFTLMELLIAITVFAVLGAMSYGGLNTVLKTRSRTAEAAEQLHTLQIALMLIQRDITQIINQPSRNEFGDMQPPVMTEFNDDRLIEFSRLGWKNPTGQLRSDFQRVAYGFEDNTLLRYYWPHFHRGPQEKPIRAELLENLQEVTFEFMDDQESWHDDWPPLNSNSMELPELVKMELELENGEKITRIFAVTQSPIVPMGIPPIENPGAEGSEGSENFGGEENPG